MVLLNCQKKNTAKYQIVDSNLDIKVNENLIINKIMKLIK